MKIGSSYEAMVIHGVGQDPVRERRELTAPGPGEAAVRLRASSLNYHDVLAAIKPSLRWPRVPLSDACGEVLAVGPGVTRVSPGDRVIPNIFTQWITGPGTADSKSIMLGDQVDGSLRQVAVWQADWLVQAPAHLSDLEAATLPAAGVTAWRAVAVETNIQPGHRVLVQGTGGVASFAIQLARQKGATVIVTSSSDEKAERAKALGAAHTINYRSQPDWATAVLELTDGKGVEVVLDMGGPPTFPQSMRAVRHGGTILPIGILGGYELNVSAGLLITKDVRIQGMSGGNRTDLEGLCAAISATSVRPVVDEWIQMDELSAGLERMKLGRHFGKIGVKID